MKIKGMIIKEDVSYNGKRTEAILLRTKTYTNYQLSDDFNEFVGYKCTIKIK